MQLELPLGLEDEKRRPGTQKGMARWVADRAVDVIRDRFGWEASAMLRGAGNRRAPFPTSFANSPKKICASSNDSDITGLRSIVLGADKITYGHDFA